MRLFELFAGIGSQYRALSNVDPHFESVGIAEWNIDSIIGFAALHYDLDSVPLPEMSAVNEYLEKFTFSRDGKVPVADIKRLSVKTRTLLYRANILTKNRASITDIVGADLPDIDCLTYSFPCQAISTQGSSNGFAAESGTTSSLLWEVGRILSDLRSVNRLPKFLLMENVPAILHRQHLPNFKNWLGVLSEMGYRNEYFILDSSKHGSPQKRLRCYCMSWLGDGEYVVPSPCDYSRCIGDIILPESEVAQKYYLDPKWSSQVLPTSTTRCLIDGHSPNYNVGKQAWYIDGHSPTCTKSGELSGIKVVITHTPPTGIRTSTNVRSIRRLTPHEQLLLMGFNSDDYAKLKQVISEASIKGAAGNSIVVEVLEDIFRNMLLLDAM